MLALKFATDACSYYLYGAPVVNIFSDCSALEGLFSKPLANIKNKHQRAMIENMMCFNLKFHHIAGTSNAIADCLSRLTRRIREAQHFPLSDPILADYAVVKKLKGYKDNIETDGSWVQRL